MKILIFFGLLVIFCPLFSDSQGYKSKNPAAAESRSKLQLFLETIIRDKGRSKFSFKIKVLI